uniref:Uncharacterized protein n=1 Tax=Panagrolaimus sp. PS1159 TaxID=55785 RepID=A0AC35F6Q3_9BILA
TFTSFSIGIGSDLEYVNLQKIATSTNHLIHSQESKQIVKDISSKLCPKFDESNSKTSPPSSIPPDAAIKNGGVKTHQYIPPSTIAFMGQPKEKKVEKFKNTKLSKNDIESIAKSFWKSSRNDSVFEFDENEDEEEKLFEDSIWIGMKRGDLGKMEWSDGSRLEEFEQNLAKHLDIEIDRGDCIQQNIDMVKINIKGGGPFDPF